MRKRKKSGNKEKKMGEINKPQIKQQSKNLTGPMLHVSEGNKRTGVKVPEAQAGAITGAGNCKQGLPVKSSQIISPRRRTVNSGFVYNKGFSHFLVSRTLHILKKFMEDCRDLLFMWVIAINSYLIKN